MRTRASSPGAARPAKFTTLLWRVRPRSRSGSVRERPLHEDLERAPHEALGALARPALDHLDEALHARDLHVVGDQALADQRSLGAAPRREDERERTVVANLIDHLERLARSPLGLAGEPDNDVGRERASGRCSRIIATRSR